MLCILYLDCMIRIMWLQNWVYKQLLFIGVISILLVNIAQAQSLQRMEVSQVSAPDQGVAVFMDYPDKAAIIIESPITSLRFSSNMNGIVQEMHEPERGRYVLIVEPFTQILVVDSPGFIQQRQRIGSPQPREVRYFEVKPEERASELISVIFNVTPSNARLFINGQETPVNQTTQLAPGSVEVRLEREGYRTITDVVEVNDQNIQFNYVLEEIDIVPVRIQSNVEGASVIIDGTNRGEIDRSGTLGLFLYPGSYSLQIMRQGYVTKTVPLEVAEDGENAFTINLVRNLGELVLKLIPADANVSLNRIDYTGQEVIDLAPGRYRLEVQKEYYEPYSETIDIELNQELTREIELAPHTGTLQFSVSPNDAQVELVNDRGRTVNEWTGIQLLRDLKAGTYTLKATAEGHLSTEQDVAINKNQVTEANVKLEPLTVGSLHITSKVSNSEFNLYREGKLIYSTNGNETNIINQESGSYQIVVSSEGYRDFVREVKIGSGETHKVIADMKPQYIAREYYIGLSRGFETLFDNEWGISIDGYLLNKLSRIYFLSFEYQNRSFKEIVSTYDGVNTEERFYVHSFIGRMGLDAGFENGLIAPFISLGYEFLGYNYFDYNYEYDYGYEIGDLLIIGTGTNIALGPVMLRGEYTYRLGLDNKSFYSNRSVFSIGASVGFGVLNR